MQTHISTTILFSWLLAPCAAASHLRSSVAARLSRPRCDVIRCAISKPPPKPVPPRPALGAGARAALPPRADVAELLELFNTLPVHWGDADERGAHQPALGRAHAIGLPLPDGGSSDLSIDAVARAGKRWLATPAAAEERQEALAALSAAALAAGRARSARLAYELCARRVGKWRATNSTVQAARSLEHPGQWQDTRWQDTRWPGLFPWRVSSRPEPPGTRRRGAPTRCEPVSRQVVRLALLDLCWRGGHLGVVLEPTAARGAVAQSNEQGAGVHRWLAVVARTAACPSQLLRLTLEVALCWRVSE